jgi:hypothetical protein
MKKLLILFLAFGLLTACNNNKTKADKTDNGKTEKENTDNKDAKTTDNKESDNKETTDNNTSGWPQKDRDDFIGSCVDKAYESSGDRALSENYCECMLGKIEQKYPNIEDAKKLTDTDINALLTEYAEGCRSGR